MAMQCPQCRAPVRRMDDPDYVAYCPRCGWGKRSPAPEESGPADSGAWMVKLVLAWAFSLALIFGPYTALLVYFPAAQFWVHLAYWLVMFIYLAAAGTTTPSYDSSNLGLAGSLIDNPFSWEDDLNRAGLMFAILLLPGKVFAWALVKTWHVVRG